MDTIRFVFDSRVLYQKDNRLQKGDVMIIQEWLKKQPHLPKIEEFQVMFFLHCCYYQIELAKKTIDIYFTLKTHHSDLFDAITDETVLRQTMSVAFVMPLPKLTPENYLVIMFKLLDSNAEKFDWTNQTKMTQMVATLYVTQQGFEDGLIVLFDMKGFTLAHLTKLSFTLAKTITLQIQEAAPVRIKGIHFINPVPFVDKLVALAKLFLKNELLEMLQFHSTMEALYKQVPKQCLPEEYGGDIPSMCVLQKQYLQLILKKMDIFRWHDSQKVDETKRLEKSEVSKSTVYGADGTFKKIEID